MPQFKSTKKQQNVLVVCQGNICRSPLAAALLSRKESLNVRGRGFGPSDKKSPKKIRVYAESIGINLDKHRSQQITQNDVDWADVVIYMDNANYKKLIQFKGGKEKAWCLAKEPVSYTHLTLPTIYSV